MDSRPSLSYSKENAVFASNTLRPMFEATPKRELKTNKLSDSYVLPETRGSTSALRDPAVAPLLSSYIS